MMEPMASTDTNRLPRRGSLTTALPLGGEEERFDRLLERRGLRIERIVSTGQASPPGFWYDQPEDEFVVLITGGARLHFETGDVVLDLTPGDWVEIPAHARHRVEATQAEPATVWLAVHFQPTG